MNTKLIAKNPTAYHNYIIEDKIEIDEITDKDILFDIGNVKLIGQTHSQKFKDAFDNTLNALLEE